MKKIPTLFERIYENHRVAGITERVTNGMEDVLQNGAATLKIDGSCCAIIDGKFYRRYDAKKGRTPPEGAIPCGEPDPITGHHPHWVAVDPNNPADKWFTSAYDNTPYKIKKDGTFEAIGPHFQGNPYGLSNDILEPHGVTRIAVERTFEGIKNYLFENDVEGIVFWYDGEPKCKIKRTDFGYSWPVKPTMG